MQVKPKIIIVDENDNIIGHKERGTLTKNDIYRVSALWITNSKNQILLVRRHRNKTHHPRKWELAVAGTLDEGETYKDNIIKETEEEIGPKTKTDNKYHHFTQWYTLTLDIGVDEFIIQEDEVEELKWFNKEELEKNLENNNKHYLHKMKDYLNLFS